MKDGRRGGGLLRRHHHHRHPPPNATTTTTSSSSSSSALRGGRSWQKPGASKASASASVLFFGAYWPDANASGAGVRTVALLEAFLGDWSYEAAHFASPNRENECSERLRDLGVRTVRCRMNRRDELEDLVSGVRPDVVVFDQFTSEEQYSWVVRSAAPDALRVLDMQDSHALRLWREGRARGASSPSTDTPPATYKELQRELAAIHRSDLTLVCSPFELSLLTETYGVDPRKLCLASFFYDRIERGPSFEERRGFVTLGTAMHGPNVDAVRWLRQDIWKVVRERGGSQMEVRVYGAHFETEAGLAQMHNQGEGFLVEGFASDLRDVLSKARVLVAPLRYGAGIKTKILDAWSFGTPVCTTPVGSEGLLDSGGWGGLGSATTASEFAESAVLLHEDKETWEKASQDGLRILSESFDRRANLSVVGEAIEERRATLQKMRDNDYTGNAFWHNTLRSTEYFSRWIELKEESQNTNKPS
ncbi:hypothetical protein A3770_09p57200 [Chloropicon primus]|uniref:Glycosyltransferase n=1 Tax=Chloropicon primus TaxID=1764295 RepID=A0A5B8MUN7_9CHLO|nr:hypothetical protein A3770_09p57200 [Chloropicon primus]|eukprot:QDZ23202.1 hypothetical protein A3770_09p57200 [Chloropicon primus]